ncbi:MAG TPA: tyrosine-type recombinase/integrase [Chthonomonadales bacterium]|nr:tyrosine-type recombinase/integrase [Chthonomonadales bacterium]
MDWQDRSVIQSFVQYLRRANASPHTVRAYERWMREFVRFMEQSGRSLEQTLLEEHERNFAARDFRQYLRRSRRLAPTSVNQALAALHTFYQSQGLTAPQVKREDLPQLAPRALSAEEQRRFLRAVERCRSVRDQAIAYILYYCGLRVAECVGLDVEDVFISDRRGRLIVRHGKGGRRREVPVHPVARKSLLAWLQERRATFGDALQPVFVNPRGGRLTTRSVDLLMDRLGEEAGVEVSAHVLRHTFATNLIRKGHDLVLVAELTGHARLDTVRRYSLPTVRELEAAIESLPQDR